MPMSAQASAWAAISAAAAWSTSAAEVKRPIPIRKVAVQTDRAVRRRGSIDRISHVGSGRTRGKWLRGTQPLRHPRIGLQERCDIFWHDVPRQRDPDRLVGQGA